jgi:hypothetical protein
VLGHVLEARGAVNLEWYFAPQHPGREDQVRISHGVVRMHVREEHHAQLHGFQCIDAAFHHRGLGAPHYSGAEIDEIGRAIHDHRARGTGAVRICGRRSSAEQHELGAENGRAGRGLLREAWDGGEDKRDPVNEAKAKRRLHVPLPLDGPGT